jgi:hypothetical protein
MYFSPNPERLEVPVLDLLGGPVHGRLPAIASAHSAFNAGICALLRTP